MKRRWWRPCSAWWGWSSSCRSSRDVLHHLDHAAQITRLLGYNPDRSIRRPY